MNQVPIPHIQPQPQPILLPVLHVQISHDIGRCRFVHTHSKGYLDYVLSVGGSCGSSSGSSGDSSSRMSGDDSSGNNINNIGISSSSNNNSSDCSDLPHIFNITHTFVPKKQRGKGIGTELCRVAYKYAHDCGYNISIINECSTSNVECGGVQSQSQLQSQSQSQPTCWFAANAYTPSV